MPIVLGEALHCAIVFATRKRTPAALGFHAVSRYKLTAVGNEIIDGHPLTRKGFFHTAASS